MQTGKKNAVTFQVLLFVPGETCLPESASLANGLVQLKINLGGGRIGMGSGSKLNVFEWYSFA